MPGTPPAYAKLSRRISALLVDGVVSALGLVGVLFIASGLSVRPPFDLVLAILLLGSIEPLFVWSSGGSIGQHIYGLRIRKAGVDERLGILQSYARFIAKLPLGLISLVTVLTSRRHQAIHDLLCRSIVVYRNPENQPAGNILAERIDDEENYTYPGKVKRVVIIVVYYILSYVLVTIPMAFLLSDRCISGGICSSRDSTIELVFSIPFYVSLFVIAWLGWGGLLLGCRKKALRDVDQT